MTVGMLCELMGGLIGSTVGMRMDATSFENLDEELTLEKLQKLMISIGRSPSGEEFCYNGQTGEPFKERIFIGICSYQKLKHMVVDKFHSRFRGPVHIKTRQPVDGRSRDGGLRFGEMVFYCHCVINSCRKETV